MTVAERSRALYWRRRAARQCTRCEAGLQESDAAKCVECVERARNNSRRMRLKNPGVEARRENEKYRANPEPKRAYMRLRRKLRFKAGYCSWCRRPRMSDSTFCVEHREVCRLRSYVDYLKREGRPIREAKRALRAAQDRMRLPRALPVKPDTTFDDNYDPEPSWTDRMLRAIRWFDWATATEVCESLGVTDPTSTERNSAGQALVRLAKYGLVDKRQVKFHPKTMNAVEYRINEAGRAELGAIRRAA